MKGEGINSTDTFILAEDAPILEYKNGNIEDSGKKLLKGTVVKGLMKTRIISVGKEKAPYRFIQLENKKGYLSPQVVNLYIGNFANLDGSAKKDNSPVHDTAFGQKTTKFKKTKNVIINYGLPVIGGVVGYKIAKRMDADMKKTVGFVLFFGLIACIPRYIYRNK